MGRAGQIGVTGMIGVVLISHGGMAEGMVSSGEMLYPNFSQVECLPLWPADNPDEFQEKLEGKIKSVDTGGGVIILTDLMGGTPCNRALYSLSSNVRMLAGMNLPMLLALLAAREQTEDLDEIATLVLEEAHAGTLDVNEALRKRGIIP